MQILYESQKETTWVVGVQAGQTQMFIRALSFPAKSYTVEASITSPFKNSLSSAAPVSSPVRFRYNFKSHTTYTYKYNCAMHIAGLEWEPLYIRLLGPTVSKHRERQPTDQISAELYLEDFLKQKTRVFFYYSSCEIISRDMYILIYY